MRIWTREPNHPLRMTRVPSKDLSTRPLSLPHLKSHMALKLNGRLRFAPKSARAEPAKPSD